MVHAMARSVANDRAMGALAGVALGDAMGMPSQTLSRADIRGHYGRIEGFTAPFIGHPASHGLMAGQVTDDTEQTLLLAGLLTRLGGFNDKDWAAALLDWEADVRARNLRDLLGPSSKAALKALIAGVPPSQTGRTGTTNGAAMRIVPVGIANPVVGDTLVDAVEAACRVTHATGEAIAAAAAVAMVISLGVSGARFEDTLEHALKAAQFGNMRGAPVGERDMPGRIAQALDIATAGDEARLAARIGTSVASRESVATAFGVVRLAGGDPWSAAVIAANIGDDTDTIGAIACGMAGACSGLGAFPVDRLAELQAANDFDLGAVASDLLRLRFDQALAPVTGAGAA